MPTKHDASPHQSPPDSSPEARARGRVAELGPKELGAEILSLTDRLAAGTYELLVLIGELDARGSWAGWGALSCAAWLAQACDIDASTARRQVGVARAMRRHPLLDAAMRDGDVSYAKARALVAHLTAHNAQALVEIATRTPAAHLGKAIAAWEQRNEDPAVIAARQHEERYVSWRTDPDGMITITARLTPEAAGDVTAVVDQAVMADRAPAGASLGQQRADALVGAITNGGGKVDTEVVVHVRPDGNTLADGTPLGDHAVTELLPTAFVSLLVHDMHDQPIDASPRRRYPTPRQRRVIDERQHVCQHPGCTAHDFLQYDHIHDYTSGGPTILGNLQRLCGPHNRAKSAAR